jgi:hypothetical protein
MKPYKPQNVPCPRTSANIRVRWFMCTGNLPPADLFRRRDQKRQNQKVENYSSAWDERRKLKIVE